MTMASRFSWFLGSLLVVLFCHDVALSDNMPEDIKILQGMTRKGKLGQVGVLYLKGRDLSGLTCHEIAYNNAANVDANCNFAPVFDVKLEGTHETFRHSEWQLIYTALRPMLEKWQEANPTNSSNANCPESLYLYSYLAPDFIKNRRKFGHTCTQAIVRDIPKMLSDGGCSSTNIVVGFSLVNPGLHLEEACKAKKLITEKGITEYHLLSTRADKQLECHGVSSKASSSTG
ncbi:uncharacterized protein LOC119591540 [Penaeus monodon]|uniref:uncharacterized protein LOC119591540 n=1 Tax=Penaeus monodon TaxID=6687 RepID=UPI0018A6F547|nr:uncharacterized protein LOC119591540 [Penaeus monodon]XP_037796218.1 uncharacterized protein LOC119591540 [Penaeus monodon]